MSGPAKRTLVIPLTGVKSNPGLANANHEIGLKKFVGYVDICCILSS